MRDAEAVKTDVHIAATGITGANRIATSLAGIQIAEVVAVGVKATDRAEAIDG